MSKSKRKRTKKTRENFSVNRNTNPDGSENPHDPITSRGKMAGRGNPVYDEKEFPKMAYVACAELGALDKDLAKIFGVSETSIATWKRKHQAFYLSVQAGKDYFNTQVIEKTLLHRALGFDYDEVRKEVGTDPKTGFEYEKRTVTRKKVLPDITAIIFSLKNRAKKRWADVKKIESETHHKEEHLHYLFGDEEVAEELGIDLKKVTKEDLEALQETWLRIKEKASVPKDKMAYGTSKSDASAGSGGKGTGRKVSKPLH